MSDQDRFLPGTKWIYRKHEKPDVLPTRVEIMDEPPVFSDPEFNESGSVSMVEPDVPMYHVKEVSSGKTWLALPEHLEPLDE